MRETISKIRKYGEQCKSCKVNKEVTNQEVLAVAPKGAMSVAEKLWMILGLVNRQKRK